MIVSALATPTGLATVTGKLEPEAVWIDLTEPTADEQAEVEHALGLKLPSRVRMRAIEPSSRLVAKDHVLEMIFTGLARDRAAPGVPITCLLTPDRLVTLKPEDAEPFDETRRVAAEDPDIAAHELFVTLVEESIDEISDRLQELSSGIDAVTTRVFGADTLARRSRKRTQATMQSLGRQGTEIMRLQDSLTSLQRLAHFMDQNRHRIVPHLDDPGAIAVLGADIKALAELAEALDAKIEFVLDAMLGLLAIDQNQIMMALSLIAAMFLPATLISSIFGMNFQQMPGLSWHFGFFICIGVMVVTAIGIAVVFRWRRWL